MNQLIWKIIGAAALLSLLSSGCRQSQQKPDLQERLLKKGNLAIHGAYALYPMAEVWAGEYRKEHPGVRISILPGSSTKGMSDALTSMCDIGMFSREPSGNELKDIYAFMVASDAVVGTMNMNNASIRIIRERGLKRDELREIFTGNTFNKWNEIDSRFADNNIVVFIRSDKAGATVIWTEYLGLGQEDMNGIGVYGDPGMTGAISANPGGIGYDNLRYVYDNIRGDKYPGMEVVPVDINENGILDEEEKFYDNLEDFKAALRDGKYPAPLRRNLYFLVRKDKFYPLIKEFLLWVLNEGQASINKTGFIPLPDSILNNEKSRLQEITVINRE